MNVHVTLNGCNSSEPAMVDWARDLQSTKTFKGSRYETKGLPSKVKGEYLQQAGGAEH